jgi:hypothetical protein
MYVTLSSSSSCRFVFPWRWKSLDDYCTLPKLNVTDTCTVCPALTLNEVGFAWVKELAPSVVVTYGLAGVLLHKEGETLVIGDEGLTVELEAQDPMTLATESMDPFCGATNEPASVRSAALPATGTTVTLRPSKHVPTRLAQLCDTRHPPLPQGLVELLFRLTACVPGTI